MENKKQGPSGTGKDEIFRVGICVIDGQPFLWRRGEDRCDSSGFLSECRGQWQDWKLEDSEASYAWPCVSGRVTCKE